MSCDRESRINLEDDHYITIIIYQTINGLLLTLIAKAMTKKILRNFVFKVAKGKTMKFQP